MKDKEKSPEEILGYYLIIFQTTFTGYVRCWLDGNENYTYMSEQDFLGLFAKVNADFNLLLAAKDAITTSSIYLWNIPDKRITRLSNRYERESVAETISKMNPIKLEKQHKVREISIFKNFLKRDKK